MLNPQSPPIGIDPDMGSEPPATAPLEIGGQLVVLSDGIFEAPDGKRDQYGVERVIELLDRCRHDTAAATLACIRKAMLDWQGGNEEPVDDQTVVIVQRTS
jgi:serine phosphatase RsbU (regulator of sigma subunit)